MLAVCFFVFIGYASISDNLSIEGAINVEPPQLHDVYITDITPSDSAGVTVNSTNGTVMFASVNGGGTATFTVNVINISNEVYVFDRVIEGAEFGIEGVYSGTEIS